MATDNSEVLNSLLKAREKKQPKPKKAIAKVGAKKQAEKDAEKELRGENDTLMENWFKNRRKEMVGVCLFCGGKTEKDNGLTYKRSIAHLLPKRNTQFPSIAYNRDNWLELCFYGNSCHTNFDNGIITWELLKDSKEWDIIVKKFNKLYPFIDEFEKRNIPALLWQELTT